MGTSARAGERERGAPCQFEELFQFQAVYHPEDRAERIADTGVFGSHGAGCVCVRLENVRCMMRLAARKQTPPAMCIECATHSPSDNTVGTRHIARAFGRVWWAGALRLICHRLSVNSILPCHSEFVASLTKRESSAHGVRCHDV